MEKFEIEEKIVAMLKTVYDPEIPVNVYDTFQRKRGKRSMISPKHTKNTVCIYTKRVRNMPKKPRKK